ncbi:arabinose-5-phosphate isomerase [Pseudarthrobacter sp. PvP004]|uniref:SIS domain-containing protein n=1 Tax=Pseudarthrobacter sp. PvP004 TaxID=2817850 RepID=UPI001AEB93F5|nr:SIS domain-containing protein [Pseudarthrobacter sp. PvP004]MBP2266376.1 arabinose-5-phosphate isomerase [Pseudarthrobacter sp. PvP004]
MTKSQTKLVLEAARTFIAAESRAVLEVADQLDETFVRVASLLLDGEGKVILTGAGTSGFIARRAAHLLSVSGTPAFYMNPTDGLHGSMGAVRKNDVMIALSKGGSSGEVNELAERVQGEGVIVVALTFSPDSRLHQLADIPVVLRPYLPADPGGLIAMGSTLAHSAWLDAMALVLMRARQYSWSRVHYTHPGGAVGSRTVLPAALDPLRIPHSAEPA